jgi:hypothetical protein
MLACLGLVLGLVSQAPTVQARMFGGVDFAETVEVHNQSLPLRGVGRVYYLRFFELYVGGLYIDQSVASDSVLSDVPKRLELHYVRKITAAQFVEGAEEFLSRNLTNQQRQQIQSRVEQLHGAYRDVKAGDSYALTYVPGVGTELALNGSPLIVIEGNDFSSAYLSIWLGERSLSAKFRDAVTDIDLSR